VEWAGPLRGALSRNDRISRLLKLLNLLAQSRRGLLLRVVAEEHGWPLRNLYRDVDALNEAGFPIASEAGRYKLIAGFKSVLQMGVDAEELLALFLARQQSAAWKDTRVGAALDRLQQKLAAPRMTELPAAGLTIRGPEAFDYGAHRTVVASLDRAIRERRLVDCRYEVLARREITSRTLESAELHWDPRLETLYLIAFCRLRNDLRIFAVHRIRFLQTRAERFEPRPEISSQRALRDAFRVWRAEQLTKLRLRFIGRAAALVAERRWHSSQRVLASSPEMIEVSLEVAGFDEALPWILSFGDECEVLEPAALRERLREVLRRSLDRLSILGPDSTRAARSIVGKPV
jgi:predicted DNA-binding transcriptional regulator YafY